MATKDHMEKTYYDATPVKFTESQAIYHWQGKDLYRPLPCGYENFSLAFGKIGLLIVDDTINHDDVFVLYVEQGLRRAMEYDVGNQWGWQLDGKDTPFLVLAGITPGIEGKVIKDETRPLTLSVPPEFFAFCDHHRINVEGTLRSFIADVCNIQDTMIAPREDDYDSEYDDLRRMASAYLESSYGLSIQNS
jgi:hypothetical protein